jgi:hypothetical protein
VLRAFLVMDRPPSTVTSLRLSSAADFQLHELTGANGLRAQLLPSGALFALRHQETMINQLLPGPGEDGLFRLLVRWTDSHDWLGSTGRPRPELFVRQPRCHLAYGTRKPRALLRDDAGLAPY